MPCATRCTSPFSYSQTCSTFRTTGHIATARASLGSVFLIHDFKTATCVLAFIGQLSFKLKPTCIIYRFGEFAFLLLNWVVLTSPTTIRALSLTNWVVNLWIRSCRVCLILAWIALTRCLFLARWAVANALAYLSVCLICSLSPFEAVALSLSPKSIPTLPVPHDCLG